MEAVALAFVGFEARDALGIDFPQSGEIGFRCGEGRLEFGGILEESAALFGGFPSLGAGQFLLEESGFFSDLNQKALLILRAGRNDGPFLRDFLDPLAARFDSGKLDVELETLLGIARDRFVPGHPFGEGFIRGVSLLETEIQFIETAVIILGFLEGEAGGLPLVPGVEDAAGTARPTLVETAIALGTFQAGVPASEGGLVTRLDEGSELFEGDPIRLEDRAAEALVQFAQVACGVEPVEAASDFTLGGEKNVIPGAAGETEESAERLLHRGRFGEEPSVGPGQLGRGIPRRPALRKFPDRVTFGEFERDADGVAAPEREERQHFALGLAFAEFCRNEEGLPQGTTQGRFAGLVGTENDIEPRLEAHLAIGAARKGMELEAAQDHDRASFTRSQASWSASASAPDSARPPRSRWGKDPIVNSRPMSVARISRCRSERSDSR